MLIRHFILYLDDPEEGCRVEFQFDPPTLSRNLLGETGPLLVQGTMLRDRFAGGAYDDLPPLHTNAGVLNVMEAVDVGTVVVVALPAGFAPELVVVRDRDEFLLLPMRESLCLWVVAGEPGLLVVRAKIKDDGGRLHDKLVRNLGDLPLHEYLTRKLRSRQQADVEPAQHWKDVMTVEEAADYLRMGVSTLRRKTAEGIVSRTASKKYLRAELDRYLTSKPKRRKLPKM
ncbi:MAG: helix-turn-helix domain-containing protein [Gammaproteobacteria bacterium]|nr:helix-turn-helix domain-containing protein [Gammaproteobacteria bacterium]